MSIVTVTENVGLEMMCLTALVGEYIENMTAVKGQELALVRYDPYCRFVKRTEAPSLLLYTREGQILCLISLKIG